ncbi:MAG: NfeD family protein [Microvirga sp.]|jgi:membrane protein implicated in regulation of membrane protease activity|nr:NfeD family protein [Microvirga sp.]
MIASALDTLGPWAWIILGLALMGLELLAPGVFFLWLGLAALLTGLIDWGFGLSWQASALSFAVLSVVAVLAGRAITRRPDEEDEAASNLNRRAHALVGQTFTLEAPIVDGSGRIRVGDSSWRVTGPSAPAGASVRVVRVEGATLVVETV